MQLKRGKFCYWLIIEHGFLWNKISIFHTATLWSLCHYVLLFIFTKYIALKRQLINHILHEGTIPFIV